MKNKLLLIFGFLFGMCGSLFAQAGESADRDTKYHFTAFGKYEHVMHLTCQLFEGDVQIQDFEVAVFDEQGECRASAVSGKDENYKDIAYVMIHGTSGKDKNMTVRVVYGDAENPHKYDRLVKGLTFEMANLQSFGTTLDPFRLVVSGDAAYRWQVGNGASQEGTVEHLTATTLAGATRLELFGSWQNADLTKLKTMLPKTTLGEVYLSSELKQTDLSGLLAGCTALTGVHFKAVPQGPTTGWLEGANPNSLIYLPAGTQTVPAGWTNVVAEGEKECTALTDILLVGSTPAEQHPFALQRDVRLDGHEARYVPKNLDFAYGKGGWNTIVLPFDADVYADEVRLYGNRGSQKMKRAYWLMEYGQCAGTNISFNYQRNGLTAHVPYLLAIPGDAFGQDYSLEHAAISFRSSGDVIQAVPAVIEDPYFEFAPQDIQFLGTYTTRLAAPMYLLAQLTTGGDAFVYADKGNILPFRAYMQMRDNQYPTAKILFINTDYLPTGITTVGQEENAAKVVYDLSGRRIADWERAVKGVYIVNGKKQYKR